MGGLSSVIVEIVGSKIAFRRQGYYRLYTTPNNSDFSDGSSSNDRYGLFALENAGYGSANGPWRLKNWAYSGHNYLQVHNSSKVGCDAWDSSDAATFILEPY
jgi:hypothetical protein